MSGSVWIDRFALSDDEHCPDEGDHYQSDKECQDGPIRRSGSPSLVGGTLQSRNRRQREKCHSTSGEVVGDEPNRGNEEKAASREQAVSRRRAARSPHRTSGWPE
jgi:hypothetical protein